AAAVAAAITMNAAPNARTDRLLTIKCLRTMRGYYTKLSRSICAAVVVSLSSACGDSGNPSAPAPPALTGTVTDVSGDAVQRSLVLVSPDLTAATLGVTGGNLTIT